MGRQKRDIKSWVGLLIFCLAILVFLSLVKCRADFFQDFSVTF